MSAFGAYKVFELRGRGSWRIWTFKCLFSCRTTYYEWTRFVGHLSIIMGVIWTKTLDSAVYAGKDGPIQGEARAVFVCFRRLRTTDPQRHQSQWILSFQAILSNGGGAEGWFASPVMKWWGAHFLKLSRSSDTSSSYFIGSILWVVLFMSKNYPSEGTHQIGILVGSP